MKQNKWHTHKKVFQVYQRKQKRGVALEKKNQALREQVGIHQRNFYQNYDSSGSKNNKDSEKKNKELIVRSVKDMVTLSLGVQTP